MIKSNRSGVLCVQQFFIQFPIHVLILSASLEYTKWHKVPCNDNNLREYEMRKSKIEN